MPQLRYGLAAAYKCGAREEASRDEGDVARRLRSRLRLRPSLRLGFRPSLRLGFRLRFRLRLRPRFRLSLLLGFRQSLRLRFRQSLRLRFRQRCGWNRVVPTREGLPGRPVRRRWPVQAEQELVRLRIYSTSLASLWQS